MISIVQRRWLRMVPMCMLLIAMTPAGFARASITLGTPNTTALSSGLVGYWPLDGATTNWKTGITSDMSGQGNNGTFTSMPTSTSPIAGKLGQALQFTSAGRISIANSSSIDLNDVTTVVFWVKGLPSTTAYLSFMGKRTGAPLGWIIQQNNLSSQIYMRIDTSGGTNQTGGFINNALDGTWHQIVYVFNAGARAAYKDGVLVQASTYVPGTGMSNAGNFLLNGLTGSVISMDDVRMYNRALSATEVALLYAGGRANVGVVATNALTSGLVGHWTMDGNDIGTSIADSSGNGFNGYLVGGNNATSSRKTIGKLGQAFSFGGQNTGGINLGNSSTLNPAHFTISAWMNLNKPQTWGYNYIYGSARDCNCSGATYNGIGFAYGSGALWAYIDNSTVYGFSTGVAIATSTWNHVAFSYDGSNVRLYLNGAVVKTQAHSIDPGSPATFNAYIGSMGLSNGGYFTLDGKLDDVRLYNRALSNVEIAQLAAQGSVTVGSSDTDVQAGINAGLVGYWTFDGKNMNWKTGKALDSSGGGNDGTLVGLGTTTSPTIGKVGQALKFDGTSTMVSIPATNLSLDIGTIVAWIKVTNAGGSYRGIYSQASGAGIYLYNNSFATYDNGTPATRNSGVALNDGKWHQVAMSFSSGVTNGTILYIDGAASMTTTITNTGHGSVVIAQGQGGSSQRFAGTIDDVRVYNRILSASEVLQLYNARK